MDIEIGGKPSDWYFWKPSKDSYKLYQMLLVGQIKLELRMDHQIKECGGHWLIRATSIE